MSAAIWSTVKASTSYSVKSGQLDRTTSSNAPSITSPAPSCVDSAAILCADAPVKGRTTISRPNSVTRGRRAGFTNSSRLIICPYQTEVRYSMRNGAVPIAVKPESVGSSRASISSAMAISAPSCPVISYLVQSADGKRTCT